MGNPYATLGVPPTASAAQIRGAYHTLVKRYHPDVIGDPAQRESAQEKLVEINLAYEKALRFAQSPESGHGDTMPDAKLVASSLMERGQHEAALHILARAGERDAEWYGLRGKALLTLKQPASAHESYRAAIRLDPANHLYRQGALDAAIAARRENTTPIERVKDWARGLFAKK